MNEEYNDCEAKIHIEQINKEVDEMKEDRKVFKKDIYTKFDKINTLLISGFSGTIFSIVVAAVLFLIFGK